MPSRLESVRALLADHQLDALLIQKPENRLYVTGFSGSAGMALVTPTDAVLLVDFRYVEQAAAEASEFSIVRAQRQLVEALGDEVKQRGIRALGFESDAVSFKQYQEI